MRIGRAAHLFGEICQEYFGQRMLDGSKTRMVSINGLYAILVDEGRYYTLYAFGVPRDLLGCCSSRIDNGRFERLKRSKAKEMHRYLRIFENAGYTLVGVARATLPKKTTDLGRGKLTFLSYMCMKEVVKADAPMTLELVHASGVSACLLHSGDEMSVRAIGDKLLESMDHSYEYDASKQQHAGGEFEGNELIYLCGQNLQQRTPQADGPQSALEHAFSTERSEGPIRNRYFVERAESAGPRSSGGIDYIDGFIDAGVGRLRCYRAGDGQIEDDIRFGCLPESFLVSNADASQRADIVDQLREDGHVVAYFGAKESDRQAMMRADVAISAEDAPEICKDVASILLPAGSVSGLIYSMEEGRLYYVNLQKAIKYVMMHIAPQIFALLIFVFLGTPLPISPILLFFLDYLVEVIPAVFFAYEDPEYNLITSGPKCLCTNRCSTSRSAAQPPADLLARLANYAAQIWRIVGHGTLYSNELLQFSILIAGLISAVGCTMGFFASLMLCGIPFSKCFFVSHEHFRSHSPPLVLGDGRVLDSLEQLYILYRAQSTFLVGVIICQACNLLVCRRSVNYVSVKFFGNPYLLGSFVTGIGLTIACVYTVWFEGFLLVRRPVIRALIAPFCAGALILMLDTYKKLRVRLYK